MWHISLKEKVESETTYTLVLDQLDIVYAILNLYEVTSTKKVVRYFQDIVGFTAKETCIKAI